MSLFGVLRTSTSGLAAQSNRLGTVADNIANASTHGYKRAFTEFSTVVLESGGSDYVPGSVDTEIRYGITQQGGFDFTTSRTDLAIEGNGFFVVSDSGGATALTRAGSFVKDSEGFLVNAGGYRLLGLPIENGASPALAANGTAGLEDINVATLALEATPSAEATLAANFPVTADIETDLPSGNSATAQYTAKSSLNVIDNVGTVKKLDLFITKSADNTWEVTFYDSGDAASDALPFPYANGPLATETFTFDPTTAKLASGSPASITVPVPNGQNLAVDLSQLSELDDEFQVLTATVDGNQPSAVDHVEFGEDGTLYSVYNNGSRVGSYRLPLATVASPDLLTPEAGNVYKLSAESGDLQIGFPTSGQFGKIRSSALEKSTVDTATELTAMIEAQYSFTANSKVFQTAGELLDVLVNLKR
ncbi:MAG: flagellar hook protein FlgE [Hyphomicrobium sp.]|jgi:flagellar hook protein FlgE